MSSNTQPQLHPDHPKAFELVSSGQVRAAVALMLIALGGVFFLGQAGALDFGSNWWVLFIAIPGATLLYAAFATFRHAGQVNRPVVVQLVIGLLALLLALIFVVDPNWTFTHHLFGIQVDIPFLNTIDWDRVWSWFLVVPGAGLLLSSFLRRVVAPGIFGGVLMGVGLVFVFDISWDAVWPLAIAAVGVGLLQGGLRQR
ncbi:MAG: hypothetical protein IPK19_05730 [Chloroflexi bacterium]|nr:hypothetical protein [Chloroflexota bacterium]